MNWLGRLALISIILSLLTEATNFYYLENHENNLSIINTYELLSFPLTVSIIMAHNFMKRPQFIVTIVIDHYIKTVEGIQQALDGLTRRATFDSKMNTATEVLREKEKEIEALFFVFFQDLETFAQAKLAILSQSHDPA